MKRNRTERVITAFLFEEYFCLLAMAKMRRRQIEHSSIYTEITAIERTTQIRKYKLRKDTRIESRRKSNMKIEYE